MKKLLYLLLILFAFNVSYGQKKNAATIQPYSISNIKLGMSQEDFLSKYPEQSGQEIISNSTKTWYYDALVINNIEVWDVVVKFYKNKLILLSFTTSDSAMHTGLSAKYGYKISEEYESYENGVTQIICGYGKKNQYYDIFHVTYDNGKPERFLMMDIKAKNLSESEGF